MWNFPSIFIILGEFQINLSELGKDNTLIKWLEEEFKNKKTKLTYRSALCKFKENYATDDETNFLEN
jgi:hypothetical protein